MSRVIVFGLVLGAYFSSELFSAPALCCYRFAPSYVYSAFCILVVFFFFSSRRRHTRCLSDWSSDVCSSDLMYQQSQAAGHRRAQLPRLGGPVPARGDRAAGEPSDDPPRTDEAGALSVFGQIGRASCRERGEIWVVEGALKEKKV